MCECQGNPSTRLSYLLVNRALVQNHSYENDFDLHENKTACRTHFHLKGMHKTRLKQRSKRTRKWPIVGLAGIYTVLLLIEQLVACTTILRSFIYVQL